MKRKICRSTPNLDQLLAESSIELQLNVLSKKVATGTEGTIYLAQLLRNNQSPLFFAAKNRLARNVATGDSAEHERLMHRIASQQRQHSNQPQGILPFMGAFVTMNAVNHPQTYHAMPLAEGILSECIPAIIKLKSSNNTLYLLVIHDIMYCMLNGLTQLSGAQIVHNDLSSSNVLLYKRGWVISDFGQAETYLEFSSTVSRPRGSALNMSPEILNHDKRFPLARDMWALGLILDELIDKKTVFHSNELNSNVDYFMHIKMTRYQQLRQEQNQSNQGEEDSQLLLRQRILGLTTPEDCLLALVNSMGEILPERRPNLITFQIACDHFLKLLPTTPSAKEMLAEFYTSIQNEKLMMIHPDLSPEEESINDEVECEVFNLSSYSSTRCSPIN